MFCPKVMTYRIVVDNFMMFFIIVIAHNSLLKRKNISESDRCMIPFICLFLFVDNLI